MMQPDRTCSFLMMHKYYSSLAGQQCMARLHTMGAATNWCKVDGCEHLVQALV